MRILDLLAQDGIHPKKVSTHKGGEFHSPCPGCGGQDRFHSWPEQYEGAGSWWCRVCGSGGDTIQYLIDYRGMDFKAAANLCGRELSGGEIRHPVQPSRPRAQVFTPQECEVVPPLLWQRKAEQLVQWAHRCLLSAPEQMAYLAGRGIALDAVKEFRLGFNPGERGKDIHRSRTGWGLEKQFKDNGREKSLWIPRGLTIPYYRDGILVRVRIRRPEPIRFGAKYCVVSGSVARMPMVINPGARAYVIQESELDAILCAISASESVGAIGLGSLDAKPDVYTHNLLRQSVCILNALDAEHIYPADDSEKAKAQAEKKAKAQAKSREWWQKTYNQCERWPVPEQKDAGDAYAAGVDVGLWIRAGLPPVLSRPLKTIESTPDVEVSRDPLLSTFVDPPADVVRLQSMLSGTQIFFDKGKGEFGALECPPQWAAEHWELFRRVGDLIWSNPVQDWIWALPVRLVGAENILHRGGGA